MNTNTLILIAVHMDQYRLGSLKQYLDTEYSGWSVVSTDIEHAGERVDVVVRLPGTWSKEDEKAWNELSQEKLILSFHPVSEVKTQSNEQVIQELLGALRSLVGEDSYLEDECECDNTHANNQTVCRICWARDMFLAYGWTRGMTTIRPFLGHLCCSYIYRFSKRLFF